jgi:hypothetical protein
MFGYHAFARVFYKLNWNFIEAEVKFLEIVVKSNLMSVLDFCLYSFNIHCSIILFDFGLRALTFNKLIKSIRNPSRLFLQSLWSLPKRLRQRRIIKALLIRQLKNKLPRENLINILIRLPGNGIPDLKYLIHKLHLLIGL